MTEQDAINKLVAEEKGSIRCKWCAYCIKREGGAGIPDEDRCHRHAPGALGDNTSINLIGTSVWPRVYHHRGDCCGDFKHWLELDTPSIRRKRMENLVATGYEL